MVWGFRHSVLVNPNFAGTGSGWGGLSKVGLCGFGLSAGVCVCACACVRACECMCVYCIYVSVYDVSDGQRTKYCKQK